MQTYLDDMGRLLYYRVTFPIPKEYAVANFIKIPYRQFIKNKWYYVNQSQDYDKLVDFITKIQISVARFKIHQLQNKIKQKQCQLKLEIE